MVDVEWIKAEGVGIDGRIAGCVIIIVVGEDGGEGKRSVFCGFSGQDQVTCGGAGGTGGASGASGGGCVGGIKLCGDAGKLIGTLGKREVLGDPPHDSASGG